ncbi:hypothetical protein HUJ04_011548 [Dendroctonus ponderosae]|nr:hypothetical protein HUJ04_011548 [Dendroctonus ponderosae]
MSHEPLGVKIPFASRNSRKKVVYNESDAHLMKPIVTNKSSLILTQQNNNVSLPQGSYYRPTIAISGLKLLFEYYLNSLNSLNFYKTGNNQLICTIDFNISTYFFIEKYLFWVNNFTISHPNIFLNYFVVAKNVAVYKLCNTKTKRSVRRPKSTVTTLTSSHVAEKYSQLLDKRDLLLDKQLEVADLQIRQEKIKCDLLEIELANKKEKY